MKWGMLTCMGEILTYWLLYPQVLLPSSWSIVPSSPIGHSHNPDPLSSLMPNHSACIDLPNLPVEWLRKSSVERQGKPICTIKGLWCLIRSSVKQVLQRSRGVIELIRSPCKVYMVGSTILQVIGVWKIIVLPESCALPISGICTPMYVDMGKMKIGL